MRRLFRKVFKRSESVTFRRADLTETTQFLSNPARGWYQLFTFAIEKEPNYGKVKTQLDEKESLVLVLINIGAFGNEDLPKEALMRIREILTFFKEENKDIVLRVSYDHVGKALEREPSLFAQVLKHLHQIGGIIEEFQETIFVYQGMLVGNWGEMHTSKFLLPDQLKKMAEVLRQYSSKTYLAVRCPMQWRELHNTTRQEVLHAQGIGLYDDAIFATERDMGTFGIHTQEVVGWSNPWTREEELAFINELCKEAPNGGEAVYGEGFWETLPQHRMIYDMQRMHITYLNRMYDRTLLDAWEQTAYSGKGVWAGRSLYEYIGAHLGYRYVIKNVKAVPVKREEANDGLGLEIEIENTGFANLYQEAEVCLEWTGRDGVKRQDILKEDLKYWHSQTTVRLQYVLEDATGDIYLSAKRKRDGRMIYFANEADEAGRVLLGSLEGC